MQMRRSLVAAAVVTLLLVACGGARSDGDAQNTSQPAETVSEEPGETVTDFIPGAVALDSEALEEQSRRQEQQVQEMIAECMAEQGFEYIPYVPNRGDFVFVGSQEEYVEQYGMDISYDLLQQPEFSEEDLPPYIADDPDYAIPEGMSPDERENYIRGLVELVDDPNFAIREAMLPDERRAYDAALNGPEPDIDYETMTEDEINAFFETWQPDRCYTDEYEVFGGESVADQVFSEQFGQAMDDHYQSMPSDPRIVELTEKWSACMAEQGYDFSDEQGRRTFILRRLEEAGAIFDLEFDPDGYVIGYESERIEPGSDMYKAVETIFEEEVAIAKASLACHQSSVEVWTEVYEEYEQRFIDENRAALEKFRDENS